MSAIVRKPEQQPEPAVAAGKPDSIAKLAGNNPPSADASPRRPKLTAEVVRSGEAFWKAAGVFHRLR